MCVCLTTWRDRQRDLPAAAGLGQAGVQICPVLPTGAEAQALVRFLLFAWAHEQGTGWFEQPFSNGTLWDAGPTGVSFTCCPAAPTPVYFQVF